eukprot:scaffold231976_cov17-Tisochrysis_lutea.AAC.1
MCFDGARWCVLMEPNVLEAAWRASHSEQQQKRKKATYVAAVEKTSRVLKAKNKYGRGTAWGKQVNTSMPARVLSY